VSRLSIAPRAICPLPFCPQQYILPSACAAQVCWAPTASARGFVTVETIPGAVTGIGPPLPLPSCPKALLPQQTSAPGAAMAQVWATPVPTASALDSVPTVTGCPRLVVVPSPSCPWLLAPQQATSPAPRTAQACRQKVAI
jgi:hypothetical protein